MKNLHAITPKTLKELLDARISFMAELKERPEYDKLFFSGSYGGQEPLSLDFHPPVSTRRLAFALEGKGPLSLSGISVQTQENELPRAVLRLSSENGPASPDFQCGATVFPGIFTTGDGEAPRAYLGLSESSVITGLTVTNRERELWRNHSLSIAYEDEEHVWCPLFSHGALVERYMEAVRASRCACFGDTTVLRAVETLDTILLTLMYDACPKSMMDLSISDIALLGTIKDHVSRNIFWPLEKEITPHGIIRSFRFWPEAERMEYFKDAVDVVKRLEEISPEVIFVFGSVLGFVREQTCFIPHDDDHDIMIFYPESRFSTLDEAYGYTEEQMHKRGLRLLKRLEFVTKVAGPRSGKGVDVFASLYDAQGFVTAHPYFRGKYLHMDMLFPAAKSTIWGLKCNLPHNVIDYLAATYGAHWRTPLNSSFTSEHNRIHVQGE